MDLIFIQICLFFIFWLNLWVGLCPQSQPPSFTLHTAPRMFPLRPWSDYVIVFLENHSWVPSAQRIKFRFFSVTTKANQHPVLILLTRPCQFLPQFPRLSDTDLFCPHCPQIACRFPSLGQCCTPHLDVPSLSVPQMGLKCLVFHGSSLTTSTCDCPSMFLMPPCGTYSILPTSRSSRGMSVPQQHFEHFEGQSCGTHVWLFAIPKPVPDMAESLLCAKVIHMDPH